MGMIDGLDNLTASLRWQLLDVQTEPEALLEAMFAEEEPAILESSATHPDFGRYTILAVRPVEVLTLREGILTNRRGNVLAKGDTEFWSALGKAFGAVSIAKADRPAPYVPGWIGYVGYEVGRLVERLPGGARRDTRLPDLRLAFYDALLVYDALQRRWWLAELKFDRHVERTGQAGDALRRLVVAVKEPQADPLSPPARPAGWTAAPSEARANFSNEQYRRAVRRCIDYIAAGDVFQVNLSQRFVIEDAPAPEAIYRALRRRNPSWHGAFLRFESAGQTCAVLSSSPELFLRRRGDCVLTRPIKGTRRRTGDDDADGAAAAELLASAKDNAELAMIIDLLRNDLGRVCRYGSVEVVEPRRLEAHPTVFHLTGAIRGRLQDGVGIADLLRACFPGGSITGAPKIRAMEIIDELEGLARGVYTGCIGIVGVDGNCEWNIAIRTIVCDADRALAQVGGGIVADSDPQAEYVETLDKARALLEAVAQARAGGAAERAGTSMAEAGRR
jgi:para-aminobenzoate synthetase component 1